MRAQPVALLMNDSATQIMVDSSLLILQTLQDAGFTAYWAGGCVRDRLLNRPAKDIDIATSARPEEVLRLFPGALEVGKSFGVVKVSLHGCVFDVATFRRDLAYADGRHPQGIEFAGPEEDARRRDFTINGLFCDPRKNLVIDFVGGQEDLRARRIRTIGEPMDRFGEDYLRLLRAARFSSVLEFSIDPETAAAIRTLAPRLSSISAERIQGELTRILLESPRPGHGIALLQELGLLRIVLPEVAAMDGVPQPPEYHPEGDVFTHTVMMLYAMSRPDIVLAWSVLLHDVGKPATIERVRRADGTELIRFRGHAEQGADIAARILERLRMPGNETDRILHCIRQHMKFIDVPRMRRSTLRRMIGAPTFEAELELHRLDCACSHGDLSNHEFLLVQRDQFAAEPPLPEPWVNGHDIMALGIPEGPLVGSWHRRAYDAQLEGRFAGRKDLLAWLKEAVGKEIPPTSD